MLIIFRIFWGTFIVGSAIIGTIMILKTNEKLPNNQVISYDDSMEFKGNVIFPAITIIPEVVIKRNYDELFTLFRSTDTDKLDMMMQNETFKNDVTK